ncbi:MAG: hypothetical protein AAF191_02645 [Verrucomicrobiota bacterium]
MNLSSLLAQTTEAAEYYWIHQILGSLGLGLVFFLGGLFFAALVWSGRKKKSLGVEVENEDLRKRIAMLAVEEPRGEKRA